jgi:hypothetical protein
MIYKDGRLKCTGEMCGKVRNSNDKFRCSAINCPIVAHYRDKLMAEEVVE